MCKDAKEILQEKEGGLMQFAIKIGDKYLQGLNSDSMKGKYKGHTPFVTAEGATLELSDEPKYFCSRSVAGYIEQVVDLIRWQDIEAQNVMVIPKVEKVVMHNKRTV